MTELGPNSSSDIQRHIQQHIDTALQALSVGDDVLAQKSAQAVLVAAPETPLALLILGVTLHSQRLPGALPALKRAVSLAPTDAQFRYNYAVTLAESGQDDLALVEYRACLNCDPNFRDALWNYGEMLRLREHFEQALVLFDRLQALEGSKRHKMAHRMAVCCGHINGMAERAEALFQEQIALDDDPKTHWEYAFFLLGQGRFAAAWPHYARRFDAGPSISLYKAPFPYPAWDGVMQAGTLLIHGEQGAGDELLFAAFLPELLGQAQAVHMRVIVACRAALVGLFQASFPEAVVLAHDVLHPADVHNQLHGEAWQITFGDLPLFISKPVPCAYLQPQPQDVVLMREAVYEAMRALPQSLKPSSDTKKIGLVWSANPVSPQANRQSRNLPPGLINGYASGSQGVQFFSLQTPEHRPGLAYMPDMPIHDLSHLLTDFSRTAALMQHMDEVVSVCTSTANLAGALGCPTRVLLQKNADWRWWQDTAWYPRIKTYRQTVAGDWSNPVRQTLKSLGQPI